MKENFLFFILLFEIIKTIEVDGYQMEIFGENDKSYTKGQFAVNSKGDMIIEYSYEGSRLFYGIKKNGEGFFNGEYIKKVQLNDENEKRYESQNIFISLKNSNNDDTQYLLNFGAYVTVVELINVEGNIEQRENYIIKTTNEVFGNSIFSYVNSLIELNNNKEYLLVYFDEQNYFLKKLSFSGFNLDNIAIKEEKTNPDTPNVSNNRMVNGIVLNNNYILVLFISGTSYFYNIFDFELNLKYESSLDSIEEFKEDIGLFAKAINLKENYIAFFYYKKKGNPIFQLKQIENFNDLPKTYLNFQIIQYDFLSDPMLNEVIKLNAQRCAFFAFKEMHKLNDMILSEVSDSLTILLFDLYNNYQNLKIREYEIRLETYKYHREISAGIYNGFICFSSSVYQIVSPNNIISIFKMFGYFNQTNQENNKTIDIYEYFSDGSNNNKNIIDDILENIEIPIENNIFGYIFLKDSIKLS